ncbi:hypothetical protein Acr_00g0086160 [Actinidia rufa]|uniref:Uncharacterized protein n=1 Tax=Actinidia rufa TaxID=165716 RepID=A0A7J0DVV3_9ERIC|nr:hypothetical protein Acr_00g0086160 [Actinidia rufa]
MKLDYAAVQKLAYAKPERHWTAQRWTVQGAATHEMTSYIRAVCVRGLGWVVGDYSGATHGQRMLQVLRLVATGWTWATQGPHRGGAA